MSSLTEQTDRSVAAEIDLELSRNERRALSIVLDRMMEKTLLPRIIYRDGKVTTDHKDQTIGHLLLSQACGASSIESLSRLFEHLINFCDGPPERVERHLNAFVSAIACIEPRDDTEMMLATQMVLTHELSMNMALQVRRAETIPQQDCAERGFNKMARTYTMQMDALRKHRRGGEQKVTVEHVTVNSGGQAIVGSVETGGRCGDET